MRLSKKSLKASRKYSQINRRFPQIANFQLITSAEISVIICANLRETKIN